MRTTILIGIMAAAGVSLLPQSVQGCTGITLKSKDQATVLARTIEWGGSDLKSQYVVVPRGHVQQSYTPGGIEGMRFTARYGYVGLAVEQKEFIAEGLNEEGLSAGLFYFPGYGAYEAYDPERKAKQISDLQLVAWILGSCKTVDEVQQALGQAHIHGIDPRASTVHWRFADQSGRQVVLEIVEGKVHFFENRLGVLTNSPGFNWQLVNLNNYVNLLPGSAPAQELGAVELRSFGVGSGFLGIPGDVTPPSRFVRAAFYQATAPQAESALHAVLQSFQILNQFDIPIGIEFPKGKAPLDLPSATQWTSASDLKNRTLYYRTMWDSKIRAIELGLIDFARVRYQAHPLDPMKQQPIELIRIR
jgi:choloylglycine hydrolase